MRFIKFSVIILLTALLSMQGCKTDFELTTDWKDITIVYGLINANDTAQYIKINKAFLDPKTNALELAQNPDSNYYQSLMVRMEEYNTFDQMINSFSLDKVDGNLEGYVKDNGVFNSSPNYLYKTKATINKDSKYKLVVTKKENESVTSETSIVNDLIIIKPSTGNSINMLPAATQNYKATWKNVKDAAFYGLTIRFYYTEFHIDNPSDSAMKYFDWLIFTDYVPETMDAGVTSEFSIYTSVLYEQVAQNIKPNPDLKRIARWVEFNYAAGAPELYTYYLVNQSKNGITSGQISPDYTNINNGLGIFSSRSFKTVPNVPLKFATIDSLACNKLTHNLNFLNSQGQLCQ